MYRSICLGRVASTGGILKHEDEGLTVFIVLFALTFWIFFEKKNGPKNNPKYKNKTKKTRKIRSPKTQERWPFTEFKFD